MASASRGNAGAVTLLELRRPGIVRACVAGLLPRPARRSAPPFTAVGVGAAQQTLGNVLAGVVLLAARPLQIGDRVRFAG